MNQAIIPELNQPKQRLYFIDIARRVEQHLLLLEIHSRIYLPRLSDSYWYRFYLFTFRKR